MFETRKKVIFDLVSEKGTVTVDELTTVLGVSDQTIRRDIRNMDNEGLLRRVHGGAVALERVQEDKPFRSRQVLQFGSKRAIARAADSFLHGGESIYLDGSTTCGELAKLLGARSDRFSVVTDSLYVVEELRDKDNIDIILLGGVLERDKNTFDGLMAVNNAHKVMVERCFFSARGFSASQISNAVMTGSQVKQILIQQSQKRFLLADSTKFGQAGLVELCGWDDVDVLISDNGLDSSQLNWLSQFGVEIVLTEPAALKDGATARTQ